jgi:hypothetical protein
MSGQLQAIDLCDEVREELEAGHACKQGTYSEDEPCKHVASETAARVARRVAVEVKRAGAHSSKQDKEIQAQRDTQASISEAMNKMTEVLSSTASKKIKKVSE